ncbi:MAG: hypothetical protein QOF49_1873, partial [Chloroflexota bacterium]|nr:hypothetical protein [Chloroflexota bacterium]
GAPRPDDAHDHAGTGESKDEKRQRRGAHRIADDRDALADQKRQEVPVAAQPLGTRGRSGVHVGKAIAMRFIRPDDVPKRTRVASYRL